MADHTKISILRSLKRQDASGEVVGHYSMVRHCVFSQRTENGGRENSYASRITQINEVTYTIRWIANLDGAISVKDGEQIYKVVGIQQEGFRKKIHLTIKKSDVKRSDNSQG